MKAKSPFLIKEEFISPLFCEEIIDNLGNVHPNYVEDPTNGKQKIIPLIKENKLYDIRIAPVIEEEIVPEMESYYDFTYEGYENFNYEWYPEGYKYSPPNIPSHKKVNGNWVRTSEVDFLGYLFLNDYNSSSKDFDPDWEVMGGELAFPNFDFSIQPERGMLVIFPSAPNFIHTVSNVDAGELNLIRMHFSAEVPYEYDRNKFPGHYTQWFKDKIGE